MERCELLSTIIKKTLGIKKIDYEKLTGEEKDNLDITEFLKYSYDESVNIRMRIPVRERNSMLPMDYRKKEEIKINNME